MDSDDTSSPERGLGDSTADATPPPKRRGPNRAQRRALYKVHKAAHAERKARDRRAREQRERG